VTGVLLATTSRWGKNELVAKPSIHGKPIALFRLRRQAL
jgi:hypothetical protein